MTINLNDFITASGRYPERLKSFELTAEVIKNAKELLKRVNALFANVPSPIPLVVTSGFRPSDVNKVLPNAAKRSAHMTGQAIDLADPDGVLDKMLTATILKAYDLHREDSSATVGWCHLQIRPTVSGKRIFKP